MRLVTHILAMSRAVRLGRELREIERIIEATSATSRQKLALLTLRELAQAGRCEFPHLYGTPPEQRYAAWGSGADIGLARARSDNLQVRLRGIALWVAVVFHETRDSDHAQIAAVHRRVLRIVRLLKESVPHDADTTQRADSNEAAA